MEKALLDFKDLMPDAIIEDIADTFILGEDNTAVGYIEGIVVAFRWYGNTMEIINILGRRQDELKTVLTVYYQSLFIGSNVIAKVTFVDDRSFSHFYWAD